MNKQIKTALKRMKETIEDIEWFGNSHEGVFPDIMEAYAEQIVNDAKTVSIHLKTSIKK